MASNYPTTDVGTAGETGSNLGAGTGVYDSKLGNVLQFRSFVAGTGIALSEAGGEITVAVPGTDVQLNNAGGVTLVNDGVGPALATKGLTAGAGSSLTPSAGDITIAFAGEANTASNLGSGAGLFSAKVGVDLQFRSISGGGQVSVVQDSPSAGNIAVSLSGGGGVSSLPWVFRETLASGTAGGIAAAAAWTVVTFNGATGNTGTDVQLNVLPAVANEFLIANGTYWVFASNAMARVGPFRTRLWNVTDSAVAILGSTERNQTAGGLGGATTTRGRVFGVFTVAGGPKVYRFEYFASGPTADPVNTGYPLSLAPNPEIYALAVVSKLQ